MKIWTVEHLMLGRIENVKDAHYIIITEIYSYKI